MGQIEVFRKKRSDEQGDERQGGNMSHADGQVCFSDGTVKHYEYDGTSDVSISALWDTYEEMKRHWRGNVWNDCQCGRDEPVVLSTDYGSGSEWSGRACRYCRAITSGWSPFEEDY